MKKKIILSVLLVLLFAAAVVIVVKENLPEKPAKAEEEIAAEAEAAPVAAEAAEPAAEPETETEPAAEPVKVESMDYDALYKAYEPDEIVAFIEGREISWEEYYGWLSYNIAQTESTMNTYRQYYGININWSDDSGAGGSFADLMLNSVEDNLKGKYSLDILMEESGVELSEESLAAIAEQQESDKTYCCGEDASDEEFKEYLREIHLNEYVYDYMSEYPEFEKVMKGSMFGKELEKVDKEAIDNYIEENGYMNVNHILLMTKDMTTGEEMDDEAKAEKLAKAEELLAELKKIKKPEKLVERFRELKDEYCEDTGKVTNPDGYVFTKGTMVAEFEAAAEELEEYGLSEIVETTYGYHILLKLPIDGDTVMEQNENGEPETVKMTVAAEKFTEALTEKAKELEVILAENFKLNMADYIVVTEM